MSNAVGAAPPPEDLTALRRWLQARTDADRLQPLPIDQIVVAVDALARLPDLLGDLQAPRRTLLVQDDVPMRRGSDELKPLVRELLTGAGRQVQSFQLEAAQDGLAHADLENVARLRSTIGGVTATVIAVGSGSVCDVAKHACFLAERDNGARLTWIMVPTAASVTAFTSSLAVLLKEGVKRSFASRFPDAVVCDLATVASAPREMTLAGLGDCCARFVSYGDWYLAYQLGLVDRYSETPLALMGEALDELYLAMAPAVGALQPEGIEFLTRQVLLAGLAQSVVNLSAPLSGTEHVVSHLLDMGAAAWGRRPALHGTQVGVATPLAARAYELLFERFDPARPRPRPPVPEGVQAEIGAAFAALDPSGRIASECWRHYGEKIARWVASEGCFDSVRARWGTEIVPRLRRLVRPAATVREILRRAGHPLRFEDLEPPIPRWQVEFALSHAHLIRDRFTVGDLFVFLGTPADRLAEELCAE